MLFRSVKPTLGAQIHRLILENTKFDMYDLGGQDRLREVWYDKKFNPSGIVYVVDCTGDAEYMKKTWNEFSKVAAFYYGEQSTQNLSQIPLLILGNKIDAVKGDYRYILKNVLFDIKKGIKYFMGYCSAKENTGVHENFNWLIGEIVKIA